MQTQTKSNALFGDNLQATVGQLVERVAVAAPGAERSRWVRWLLVAAAVFVLWRVGRGFKKLFWALFGIAMAVWWSGGMLFALR